MKILVPGLPFDGEGDLPEMKIEDHLRYLFHQNMWDLELRGELPLAREPRQTVLHKVKRLVLRTVDGMAVSSTFSAGRER